MGPLESLRRVVEHEPLDREEARNVMVSIMEGEWSDAQLGALLTALQLAGYTPGLLAGFAEVIRARLAPAPEDLLEIVDTCGMGGGPSTLNLSTGAAILAAACGVQVAKHGNRSVTSKCGSADVLEALDINLEADPYDSLRKVGIGFFFAPKFHQALKIVGPVRKQLGFRTIFNVLGPLLNPAGARRQLIGVSQTVLLRPVAEALALLGTDHSWVVHGDNGLDEISISSPSRVAYASGSGVHYFSVEPSVFALDPVPLEAYAAQETVEDNASALVDGISGKSLDRLHAMVPNAAAVVYLAGKAPSLEQASLTVIEAVGKGLPMQVLEHWREVSR